MAPDKRVNNSSSYVPLFGKYPTYTHVKPLYLITSKKHSDQIAVRKPLLVAIAMLIYLWNRAWNDVFVDWFTRIGCRCFGHVTSHVTSFGHVVSAETFTTTFSMYAGKSHSKTYDILIILKWYSCWCYVDLGSTIYCVAYCNCKYSCLSQKLASTLPGLWLITWCQYRIAIVWYSIWREWFRYSFHIGWIITFFSPRKGVNSKGIPWTKSATQAGESNTILASDSSVGCHGELAHLTCQFMMVFGLTLAMIMGHLDLNQKKWVEFVKLENWSEMHHMKCSREFSEIWYLYIYIYINVYTHIL